MVGFSNSLGQLDIADYYRNLERRVARLERGISGAPSTDVVVIASLAITGLTLTTQVLTTNVDGYSVMMRFSWNAIAQDPSEYNKDALSGYLTSWSLDGTHYTAELFTQNLSIDVGPFAQSQVVTFRVRGQTIKGTLGAYSSISNTTTADSTAPFQPSTPVVSPYLGQLAINWNGLDVSSNAMPADFRFCEVHLSTSGPTFIPSTATLVGTILRGGGTWVATGLAYGTLQYSRLVAVDTVGNRSVASTAGSGTPVQAANGDISALNVGKLTAGVITAVMTISGRLATSLTGARAEMNSSGFQAFNSSGTNTFNVDSATGNMLATGQFRTALAGSGVQYLDMTSTVDRTTINFYDTTGTNPAFLNTPADGSGNPRVGINTGAFPYLASVSSKHRLFLNNAGGIALESYAVSGGGRIGYGLYLAASSAEISRTSSTPLYPTGGKFYMDTTVATMQWFNGSAQLDGGEVWMDSTTARLNVYNTGTQAAGYYIEDTGKILEIGHRINNASFANGANDSIISCSQFTVAGFGSGVTLNLVVVYGATNASQTGVVYAVYNSGTPYAASVVRAMATTGFTCALQWTDGASHGCGLEYWAWRN
jgi:hypothetical protein